MHECEVCEARYASALAAETCARQDEAEDRPRRSRYMMED